MRVRSLLTKGSSTDLCKHEPEKALFHLRLMLHLGYCYPKNSIVKVSGLFLEQPPAMSRFPLNQNGTMAKGRQIMRENVLGKI